jgi:hypothetical protein
VRKPVVLVACVVLAAFSLTDAAASSDANWRALPGGERALMLRTALRRG